MAAFTTPTIVIAMHNTFPTFTSTVAPPFLPVVVVVTLCVVVCTTKCLISCCLFLMFSECEAKSSEKRCRQGERRGSAGRVVC